VQEFELKRTKMSITVYGQKFEVKKPTVREIENFQSQLSSEETNDMETMTSFLVSLGFNADIIKDMEMDHFMDLLSYLTGVKKNLLDGA